MRVTFNTTSDPVANASTSETSRENEKENEESKKHLLSNHVASVSQLSENEVTVFSPSGSQYAPDRRSLLTRYFPFSANGKDAVQDIELENILKQGRELSAAADEYIATTADCHNPRPSQPLQLKGKLGMVLGAGLIVGTGGYYFRKTWGRNNHGQSDNAPETFELPVPQPYIFDSPRHHPRSLGKIMKYAGDMETAVLPQAKAPARAVNVDPERHPMHGEVSNCDRCFINVNQLGYKDITNNTYTPDIIYGIVKFTMDEEYYKKYFKFIFEMSISRLDLKNSDGNIGVDDFIAELKENVYFLLSAINHKKLIRSPGLCDLKAQCFSALDFIYTMTAPTDSDMQLYRFYQRPALREHKEASIGIGARSVLGSEVVDRLADELRNALVYLAKNDRLPSFSPEAEIILRYAGTIFSETRSLAQGDFFENLIIQNTAAHLVDLHKTISRELSDEGFLNNYSARAISNLITSADDSGRKGQLHIAMLISYALILADFAELCRSDSYTYIHPSILDEILTGILDYKNTQPRQKDSHPTSHITDAQSYLPDRNGDSNKSADDRQGGIAITTDVDVAAGADDMDGAGGVNVADGSAGSAGAIGAAIGAVGAVAAADAVAAVSAAHATGTLGAVAAPKAPGIAGGAAAAVAAMAPEEAEFAYPSIANALERRASLIAKDSPEERETFVHNEIKNDYRGKEYVVSQGLKIDSNDLANVVESKIMAKSHIAYTQDNLARLQSILEKCKTDDVDGKYYNNYLRRYFKNVFDTDDTALIERVLSRFSETVTRTNGYLHNLAKDDFKNLWFVSSKGDTSRKSDRNEFYSSLSNDHIKEMPFASTYNSNDKILVVFAEKSHMTNIEHPDSYRHYQTHHLGETLLHEYTHFSACTQDYMYFSRTPTGRAKNAKSMMREFYANLKSGEIEEDLQFTIANYCRIYKKELTGDLLSFFEKESLFKSYIIMNNAASYEVFFRDIADLKEYDHIPPL